MKFVCLNCESFMAFQEVEGVREGSLGVTFACAKCGARFSMVTNAGETQMVQALGVKLGGRSDSPEPLELTRAALAQPAVSPAYGQAPVSPDDAMGESKGKCPFANMLTGMPGMAGMMGGAAVVEASAQGGGSAAPSGPNPEMAWSPRAEERLQRVPDFIRPIAKVMIEQMAKERGLPKVDESLMDAAKEKFM